MWKETFLGMLFLLFVVLTVFAYEPSSNSLANFTLCDDYSLVSASSATFTLNDSCPPPAPVGDTCDYSSGEFVIDCNENCTIDSATDTGGNNVTITGAGEIFMSANVSNFTYVTNTGACWVNMNTSGAFLD